MNRLPTASRVAKGKEKRIGLNPHPKRTQEKMVPGITLS
jgi:hypothetical protein